MNNRMDTPDILQEPISHSRSLIRSFHKAGYIPYFNLSWRHLVWFGNFDQALDLPIMNSHLGHIGVNGAEGVVACLSLLGLRQCIEKRRLANIRIAYYAA